MGRRGLAVALVMTIFFAPVGEARNKATGAPVSRASKVAAAKSSAKPTRQSKKVPRKTAVRSVAFPAGLAHHRQVASVVERPLSGSQRVVSIRHGCQAVFDPNATGEQPDDEPDAAVLGERSAIDSSSPGCQPYSYALNADGAVVTLSLALPLLPGAAPDSVLIESVVTRPSATPITSDRPTPTLAELQQIRLLDLDTVSLERSADDGLPGISAPQWNELQALVAQLRESAGDEAEDLAIQVGMRVDEQGQSLQLVSVSLWDAPRQRLLDRAVYLDREAAPGGWFSARDGRGLEREFWVTPLVYRRVSRGVTAGRSAVVSRAASRRAAQPAPQRHGKGRVHMGVDYSAARGTPVHAVAAGKIIFCGPHGAYGNLVIIEHDGGFTSYYGHLDHFAAGMAVGRELARSEDLGYVGSTGRATGTHLHFEIRHEGNYLDVLSEPANSVLWSLRAGDWVDFLARVVFAEVAATPSPAH